jgi:hypothetical protein
LDSFYSLLKEILDKYKVPEELLWACDETGVSRATGTRQFVVAPKGHRRVKSVGYESPQHVTLLGCVSALGERLPPFLLRKGKGMRFTTNPLEGSAKTSVLCYTRESRVSSAGLICRLL